MKTKENIKNNVKNGINNSINNIFYKTNPYGISLIVLVITIIVIIILAATVILTLNNNNNPISEANNARYESDVTNMQAVFTNIVAKVMAQNQGTIELNAGELNSVKIVENGVTNVEGRVNYTVNDPQNSGNKNGTIVFNTGQNNNATTFYTGRKLPLYKAGKTTWYVDSEGVISLQVGELEFGSGEKKDTLADIELKEEILIPDSSNPLLKSRTWSDTNDFYADYYKKKITKVKFSISDKVPGNRITEWDISGKRDKSVMAWIEDDLNDGYILTIAGKSKIIANPVSSYMFDNFSNLKEIENIEILDTSSVRNMFHMFYGCNNLENLDLSSFNTNSVTIMSNMFTDCEKLTNINLNSFNTSNVTNMSMMFYRCGSLKNLDLSGFDTIQATNMSAMFHSCGSLENLNVSNFDTSNVTNMSSMFVRCKKLEQLDLSRFNTIKVTNMENMFSGCEDLTNLNLSNFNTSNVTNMSSMFSNCTNLRNLNINNFDTTKVSKMNRMFYNTPMINTTISIKNAGMSDYEWIIASAATDSTAKITINYTTATSSLVDNIISLKSTGANVVKGAKI